MFVQRLLVIAWYPLQDFRGEFCFESYRELIPVYDHKFLSCIEAGIVNDYDGSIIRLKLKWGLKTVFVASQSAVTSLALNWTREKVHILLPPTRVVHRFQRP